MIKRLHQLPCLRGALLCLLSVLFTLFPCCDGRAPFALGLLAAAGMGGEGKAMAISTALTAMVFLPFSAAAPHLACVALIATAGAAFQPSALLSSRKSTAAVSAAVVLSVGGIYVVQSLSPAEDAAIDLDDETPAKKQADVIKCHCPKCGFIYETKK